jgi:hypothetical protein
MDREPLDPEGWLRSLTAEALLRADPDGPLLPVSLALQAVANAFVMLGLLPESRAEAILAAHRRALERKGFGNVWGVVRGELTVRPGAHGYWESRTAGPAGLRDVPLSVAAAGVRCPTSAAEVCFEWLKLTSAGLKLSFHATAPNPGGNPPALHAAMRRAMSEISLIDDTGHSYDLSAVRVGWSRFPDRQEREWHGQVIAEPNPAGTPAWVEFTPTAAGASGRVALPPPALVPVGAADPPWPAPAECYLAELARVTHISISDAVSEAGAGPRDTAEIVATVADSLMAVGALPLTSSLLREFPGNRPGWHTPLADRWGVRAYQRTSGFRAGEHRGLAVRLPLEQATAVIESVSARGELVSVRLYGHPWVMGEYWPMITPCFLVRATDDAGDEYEGMPGGWQGLPGHEGSGSFWLWPPVNPARTSMRVSVSTLWETAWAEVKLPR